MQPTWLLLLTSTLLLSSYHPSYTSTHAQIPPAPFTPTPLFHAQSVFIERQRFYIHGGTDQESSPPSVQTFFIDLSKPWTTSKPIYGKLPDGPPSMGTINALNINKSIWYSFYGGLVYMFNIQSGTWVSTSTIARPGLTLKNNLPTFVDPATNQLYMLNGYVDVTGNVLGSMRYDTSAPAPLEPYSTVPHTVQLHSFTATWSTLIKSAILFGGFGPSNVPGPNGPQKTMYFYSVGNNITPASDTGDGPTARFDHCMVEAYGGTKMILFGGIGLKDKILDDIYILDVATLKWTKGTPGGRDVARRRTSCAVTNDLFIAWGGDIANPTTNGITPVSKNVTIVYNLKTNQWQDTYSPDPYTPPLPPPAATTSSNSGTGTGTGTVSNPTGTSAGAASGVVSESNPSIPLMIGGVVAGLAVIGIVVALVFIFRRRRRQTDKDNLYPDVVNDSPHIDHNAYPTSDKTERQATMDNFYPNYVQGSPYIDHPQGSSYIDHPQGSSYIDHPQGSSYIVHDPLPTSDITGRQASMDNYYHNVVQGSSYTDYDAIPNTNFTGQQGTKNNFYPDAVQGSTYMDHDTLPNSDIAGRQASIDNYYRNVVNGSPYTDHDAPPTNDVTGRQSSKDNFYYNAARSSPHTDAYGLPINHIPLYYNSANSPARLYQSMARNPRTSFDPRDVLNTPRPQRHPHASP